MFNAGHDRDGHSAAAGSGQSGSPAQASCPGEMPDLIRIGIWPVLLVNIKALNCLSPGNRPHGNWPMTVFHSGTYPFKQPCQLCGMNTEPNVIQTI